MNNNATEIITKLNDVVSSNENIITIEQINTNGSSTTYQLPTVSTLKSQIDTANSNIKKMLGLEGSSYVVDGISSKKIYTLDLSREPFPISDVGFISNFNHERNWFFESLMNPLLYIKADLTGKLDNNVNKIISKRYIIKFTKTSSGVLDTNGNNSKNDFISKFLNRVDINENELINWISNTTNIGVVENSTPSKLTDEQIFDLNLKHLEYHGTFSILKQEVDSVNKKLWFHINTLNYYTKENNTRSLVVNDILILKKKDATSKYQIKEISTASSTFRLILERLEGYDPIPIGQDVLEYYSEPTAEQSVKISIGYDEYNVIFIKPIDTDNNMIGSTWSKGTAFYSNDLILENSTNNQNLLDFYDKMVVDYGAIVKDLGNRMIPTFYGKKPNTPLINQSDFTVSKINRHLTDSASKRDLEDKNNQRKRLKAQIEAERKRIIELNNQLLLNKAIPANEKEGIKNRINLANRNINLLNNNLNTVVSEILNATVDASIEPKFRIRGFFAIPEPIENQEAIQFEIEYRYSSKDGSTTPTESYTLSGDAITGNTTGYFSNWIPMKSGLRKRIYDASTEIWTWQTEDIQNAEEVNINQVDIPINANEKVDFRIRSISEVGFPDSIIYSDWSEVITVEFPDSLINESLSIKDQNIVEEVYKDQAVIEVNKDLESKGYIEHISTSTRIGQTYYSHLDTAILTSYLDSNGTNISLFNYIQDLTNRINELEEIIRGAKGELVINLVSSAGSGQLSNGGIQTIYIECEDYATPSSSTAYRTYYNNVYTIKDFYLSFENLSSINPLGLLSDRLYIPFGTSGATGNFYTDPKNQMLLVDGDDYLYKQQNNQFIWFSDKVGEKNIYSSGGCLALIDYYNNSKCMKEILNSLEYNLGIANSITNLNISDSNKLNLTKSGSTFKFVSWESSTASTYQNSNGLLATVHPTITNPTDLVENGQEKVKLINGGETFKIPINIYFKFKGDLSDIYSVGTNNRSDNKLIRYLKVYVEMEGKNRPYETTIQFIIRQHRITTTSEFNNSKYTKPTPNLINSVKDVLKNIKKPETKKGNIFNRWKS
jgi:hypothetical protein